jgi:4-amino-4-deoxy-L-arabinose transferase-like glycosyltransferase
MEEPLYAAGPTYAEGPRSRLERWAKHTPLAIVAFFAVQFTVRLFLPPVLEVDDAEMVGQAYWAWGYPNSHPPLYHWIVRLLYDLTGSWVAANAGAKYALLAGGYLFVYDAARRAAGSRLTGALAAASLLFIPVVSWTTQAKLSHSLLGFTATAATLHAATLVVMGGGPWSFAWLGFAAAAGILAKYNYLFALAALALAVACVPEARRAFQRRAALLALPITLGLIAPHLIWALANPRLVTERAYLLRKAGGPWGIPLAANSVFDGLISLLLSVALSVLPGLAVWGLALLLDRGRPAAVHTAGHAPHLDVMRRVVGVVLLGELAAFSATIFAAGYTQVHERYLLVLLAPVGLWLALRFPLTARPRAAAVVLGAALAVAVVVTVARPVSVARGNSRLTFPYDGMAQEIAGLVPGSPAVLGDRHENNVNIALRVPGATIYDPHAPASLVVIVANTVERAAEAAARLPPGFAPEGGIRVLEQPTRIGPARTAELAMQVWRRKTLTGER